MEEWLDEESKCWIAWLILLIITLDFVYPTLNTEFKIDFSDLSHP
jgi:hypothetical protein